MVPNTPELKPLPFILLLLRYGLPLVVGIHYVVAARGIGYAPDAAFGGGHAAVLFPAGSGEWVASDHFSPLWTLLLSAGKGFGLDPLFTAKILGLVFSACGVIAVYLFAIDFLRDRLLAFLAALVSGLEPGLLSLAPSGTSWGLLFALTYALLFFLRRGEFAIGGIIVGLAGLVAWPAFGLLPLLGVEALRGEERIHPVQTALAGALVTGAVLLSWGTIAFLQGWPLWSGPQSPGGIGALSWGIAIVPSVGLALAIAGSWRTAQLPLLRFLYPGKRVILAPLVAWGVICAIFSPAYLILLAPAAVVLGFDGIRRIVPSLYREPISLASPLYLSGLLLLLNQVVFISSTRGEMSLEEIRQEEIGSIAAWIRANAPPGETVSTEWRGSFAYLLWPDYRIGSTGPGTTSSFHVSLHPPGEGYREIYRPRGSGHPGETPIVLYQRRTQEQ
jgi:hypothetical protein